MAELSSSVYIYHILFMHLSVDGYLDGFQVFAVVTDAVKNMEVQIPLCGSDFVSFRYTSRSRVNRSYGSSL